MTAQEIQEKLAVHHAELRQMGIASLSLFGSTARGEADEMSDIDLLVEFDRVVGLFHFFRVQHRLEEILGVFKVDLIQRGAIHPMLREHILSETIHVDSLAADG
jgi:predicted nucleotidyltransferase